jgi:hypothetical protein
MRKAILIGLFLGMMPGVIQPGETSTQPLFTTGTSTSRTENKQTITETFVIVEYSTGDSYTMSGTNIGFEGEPGINTNYYQIDPAAATQFSETVLGTGITSRTDLVRITEVDSVTTTTSVFTQ